MMRDIIRYSDHTYRLRQRMAQPLGEELGLSPREMDVLSFLYNNPELNTARDITDRLKLAKSNLSTMIDALEKKGWLTVEPDLESKRLKRLVLNREREGELARLADYQERFLAIYTGGLTGQELETLRALLEKMDANVLKALAELEEKHHA